MSPVTTAPPNSIALRFARIIVGLREAVADCGGRRRLAGPLVARLWTRLGKMSLRFTALVEHLMQFGADAPPRKSPQPRAADAPRKPRVDPANRPMRPTDSPLRLSGRYAWLAVMHLDGAAAGSQLRFLLADPEALALLAASPRLRKLLRPLCHMLALALPPMPKPTPPA